MVASIVSDGHNGPDILTEPALFRSHVGSNVILPCNITGLADLVLLWKQGSRIIFAGDIKVRRDERFEKEGNALKITNVNEKDNGEYTCEVETKDRNNPKSITHKLLVLQSPKISTSASQHNLTVIKGSSVALSCAASGNPEPIIVWSKRNRDLAGLDHRLSENGKKLELQNISEVHAGRYTCTADNGVGNPVSEDITLKVLYPPNAVAERSLVLGGEDCSIELVCNVEGFPVPTVHWYRGTMKLVPNNNVRIVSTGMRNQLSLVKFSFSESSTVRFTCSGSSPLGTSEANFTVMGIPGTPVFGPNVTEVEPSKFLLEWTTPTFSNILEHSLIYKQVKERSSPSLLTYGENKLKIPNMLKVELNCSGRSQPLKQVFQFLLDKLEPGTRYQVRLRARNYHGWGETSSPITFKTSQFIGQPPQESQILPLSGANQCKDTALVRVTSLVGLVVLGTMHFLSCV